jgi:DNA-damage-inducible protein J
MEDIMATVNARIDSELKREAELVLSDIGLSFSSAITIYFKQIVRMKAIPFALEASDDVIVPTSSFANYLHDIENASDSSDELSQQFDEEALFNHLKELRSAV